ncbi:NAD(P)-binding domain-containing protein [Mesorhizobium sp. f-mel]
MGSSIARTLLDRGCPTWVWNRTAAKCEPLAALGAKVAPRWRLELRRPNS